MRLRNSNMVLPIAMLATLVLWQPAEAQVACGERTAIVAALGKNHGEFRRGGGLAGSSAVFEIFSSLKNGSWTILRTGTNGNTCVMAVGDAWVNTGHQIKVLAILNSNKSVNAARSLEERIAVRRALQGKPHISVRRAGVVEESSVTLVALQGGDDL